MLFRPEMPKAVRESIRKHLRKAVAGALGAHKSGQEDEDTLTGQLGYALKTHRPRRVQTEGGTWKWQINYYKFRGRGPNATERIVGADGIFELTFDGAEGRFRKSSLFQAKKGRDNVRGLPEQVAKLLPWKGASFFVRYDPKAYTGFDLDEAMKQGLHLAHSEEVPLDRFLDEVFIDCRVGDTELHYDPDLRELRWQDQSGQVLHISFAIRHSIQIRVSAPLYWGNRIQSEQAPEHRMRMADEELLGIASNPTLAELKTARRRAAKLYHADRHLQLQPGTLRIFDLFMQEINASADRVFVKVEKSNQDPKS